MSAPYYADDQITVYSGDCLDVMAELPDASLDAVVTDPPYDLTSGKRGGAGMASVNPNSPAGRAMIGTGGFMGKHWDATGIAFDPATWAHCLRLLKPGGHLLAFGGSRTWHRLSCAIEDSGFEIRDSIAWLYGSGFPKSLDVSKAIDRAAGAEREVVGVNDDYLRRKPNGMKTPGASTYGYSVSDLPTNADITAPATEAAKQWQGWGTALKPAFEPIVVARKPIRGTVAANVVEHGTGAFNIDACRVATTDKLTGSGTPPLQYGGANSRPFHENAEPRGVNQHDAGRWPTNVVIDEHAAAGIDKDSGITRDGTHVGRNRDGNAVTNEIYGARRNDTRDVGYRGEGGASRFFPTFKYQAKADTQQRPTADGVSHPTVKPLDLMRWLVRLVTPPNGVVLDPFAGSGTTAEACVHEYKRCITIEREPDYLPLIVARLSKPMEVGFDFGEPA